MAKMVVTKVKGRKQMKNLVLSSLLVVFITLLSGCNNKLEEPPEIVITTGDTEIEYVVGLNQWNGAKYDREGTFQTIMREKSASELPYIKKNAEFHIEFKGAAPDSIEMLDYVLDASGDIKYTEKEIKVVPFELENKKGSFVLDTNLATGLSSNSADYEPGASIRGFQLNCTWGENESEYAFIIRSDAM
ncbi:hypothetical protein [Paenibacillus sp. FSL K6-2524]|uniref:hypothetical protein n=1 Tax=Paenibacillus sp. FSL K6-2524 TaxID=2954516 RepID=UPI0030F83A8E